MQSTSRFIVVLGLMVALAGCSSNSDNPVVVDQPTPAPTPEPTPEPTPTPEPVGCLVPANNDCTAPGPPDGPWGCCRSADDVPVDLFGYATEFALDVIERERQDLLDGPEGRVSDLRAFTTAICEIIEENFSLCCTQVGPEDEVAVKEDNTRSEQFDVMFGDEPGFLRRNGYTAACVPARF